MSLGIHAYMEHTHHITLFFGLCVSDISPVSFVSFLLIFSSSCDIRTAPFLLGLTTTVNVVAHRSPSLPSPILCYAVPAIRVTNNQMLLTCLPIPCIPRIIIAFPEWNIGKLDYWKRCLTCLHLVFTSGSRDQTRNNGHSFCLTQLRLQFLSLVIWK